MVDALQCAAVDAEYFVNRIIKEATDAGAADARGFGFQVKRLAYHAGFPEQLPVAPRGIPDRFVEFGNHAETERAVCSDGLVAGYRARCIAAVRADELI